MSRYVNPQRFVTFVRDHIQVQPATVLEGFEPRTGLRYVISEVPESKQEYKQGQELQFGSVNAARSFVKAINGDVKPVVCVQGRL